MDYLRTFREALQSIASNKLRAVLTMLGIVIGVAAVISMLAIGNGATESITSQIEGIGANTLFVFSGGDAAYPEPLTLKDVEAMRDSSRAPSISLVAPLIQGQAQASVPGSATNTSIYGVTLEYFEVESLALQSGQAFSASDSDEQRAVAILGTEVADNLFGEGANVIGETVRIAGQPYEVIGLLEEEGGGSFGSADNRILVPLETARYRLFRRDGVGEVDQIIVQAESSDAVDAAMAEISQILRTQHTSNLGVEDFTIRNTQSVLETAASVTGTLTLFLGSIAGVSLLVGGIGIMNIMLVSVIERTKEIGLRKALGARKTDIMAQFLVEALTLSISGGLVGVALGWAIAGFVGAVFSSGTSILNPVVDSGSVVMATLFSAAVGIFFGIYPANRAAKLEPVEALRSE